MIIIIIIFIIIVIIIIDIIIIKTDIKTLYNLLLIKLIINLRTKRKKYI